MTAEIAILNRSAVALAADSAVTLGIRGQQKIYNSVDKLFQLSLVQPVGIMVYGGAEYMGVPIETVIKEFRTSKYASSKEKLSDYSDAFFDFLEKEIPVPDSYRRSNVAVIVSNRLDAIRSKALERYYRAATSGKKAGKKMEPSAYLDRQILNLARAQVEILKKKDDNPFVMNGDAPDWCADTINAVIQDVFNGLPLSDEVTALLRELARMSLKKDVYSGNVTGFVFAGFGSSEIFPKLQAFQSDGLIHDRIKRRQFRYVDIDRDGTAAHIEPFAQKEMVERFLDGIDPSFEAYLQSAILEALQGLGSEIVEGFVRSNKKRKAEIVSAISVAAGRYVDEFRKKSNVRKADNYRQKIMDMVHYMPKSDLANMAESLVNLTSTKRRVSAESETVGGPIDVAVISKHDGFVWIKRKHYFEKDQNPRFFVNLQNAKTP